MAFAGQGKVRDAAAEQKRFERERKAIKPEMLYLLNNRAGDLLTLCAATIEAQLAGARKDSAAAIAGWRLAVAIEDTLQYDEPPPWIYAVRQSLGAAQLRGGDAVAAEKTFREALATRPREGRLLYGLWQSLLAQNRASEAQLVEGEFERAWQSATVPLTLADL